METNTLVSETFNEFATKTFKGLYFGLTWPIYIPTLVSVSLYKNHLLSLNKKIESKINE